MAIVPTPIPNVVLVNAKHARGGMTAVAIAVVSEVIEAAAMIGGRVTAPTALATWPSCPMQDSVGMVATPLAVVSDDMLAVAVSVPMLAIS